jgi:hypothetical protein
MGNFLDLAGRRFGRLIVLNRVKNRGRLVMWLCHCACGRKKILTTEKLTNKNQKSCGCMRDEATRKRCLRHGHARGNHGRATREYRAWSHAKARCYNPNDKRYPNCGGCGIEMSRAWREDFQNFLDDLGPCPAGARLVRFDTTADFDVTNCAWEIPEPKQRKRRKK